MALIKADRVRETTTTTGTGAISLAGASTGYVAFSTVCADGDTCYYVIVSQTGTEWETGLGTFSTPATFTRTTVHSSSNSGSAVSFTAGTKDIFIALTATQFSSIGTVTQVQGTGTINGITLTGNVTSSGNLTLGGALTGVNLGSQVTGTLAVTNGGTGTANGSITGTGELVFTSPANGASISLVTNNQTPAVGVTTNGGTLNVNTGRGYHYEISGPYVYWKQTGKAVVNGIEIKTAPCDGAILSSGNETTLSRDSLFIGRDSAMSIPMTSSLSGFSSCTGIGTDTFKNATYPQSSVALGHGACGNGADYLYSTAIGNGALKEHGYYDTAVGASLTYKTSGSENVGVGFRCLIYGTTFNQTTAIGMEAGAYATSNTAIYLDKATKSVFVGWRSRPLANDATNEIVIGADAIGKGTNSTVIGNTSTNAAYIYGNTLNLGNGASAAAITANGALTVTAGGTNQDVTLTPSGTGKVNAPAIKETVFAITDGASVDINPANGGIQTWTLGANRTPTASSFAEGQSVTLMVDDGTAYAITWSSVSPTWIGGSAPTLATSGYTVIELWKRSSTIYGALVGTA
jgi:hypothetical protein